MDNRRWIGGIVRCEKEPSVNHHNHPIHGAVKIAQCVKQKIHDAAKANRKLTLMQIATGTGMGYIPSAVESASSHLGKIARELKMGKCARNKRQGFLHIASTIPKLTS